MIKTILVPTDGSVHADVAVDWASDLALKYAARMVLLHVIPERRVAAYPIELRDYARSEKIAFDDFDLAQSLARHLLEAAEGRARAHGASAIDTVIAEGNAAKTIIAEAKRLNADLIVMGRRGLGDLPTLLVGSVSSKVLHLAECACLTVK